MIRATLACLLCACLAACQSAGPRAPLYAYSDFDMIGLELEMQSAAAAIPARSYAVQAEHWRNIDAANQRAAGSAIIGVGPKTCSALYGTPSQWSCL